MNFNIIYIINEDECIEFMCYINVVFVGDFDIGNCFFFLIDMFEMFDECKDGLVFVKFINDSVLDMIDECVLNWFKGVKKFNVF